MSLLGILPAARLCSGGLIHKNSGGRVDGTISQMVVCGSVMLSCMVKSIRIRLFNTIIQNIRADPKRNEKENGIRGMS